MKLTGTVYLDAPLPRKKEVKKNTESELLYFIDRPTRTELAAAAEPLAEGRNNPYLA